MDEIAWLIERNDRGRTEWLEVNDAGLYNWTSDPSKPVRFAREVDGNKILLATGLKGCTVTEHVWSKG